MRRLLCLDGLRGLLACYVMLSHAVPFAVVPRWLESLFSHGGAGVDVFFVLSGLVIVQSLAGFGYQARPFLIARVARIFPVFLVVFALAVAVQPVTTAFEHMPWIGPDAQARVIWSDGWPNGWYLDIVSHLTMIHGLFPDGIRPYIWNSFLGAAWSLSTEWQFYLLAVVIGQRFGKGTVGLRRLAWLFLAISGAAVVWHAAAPDGWQFSRAFLPNKAQYFALGIASAVVVRDGWTARGCYLPVLCASLVLCFAQGGMDKLLPPLVWTVCLAAQLWPSHAMLRPIASALCSRSLVWLGAVSYCIYLVNEPIEKLLGVILARATAEDAVLFTAIRLPAAALLPLLAAWWLHKWIEAPALRRGRDFARRGLTASLPVTAG